MKPSKKTFTTTDIARLGIKRERLKEWITRGYIGPSIESATGAGTKNLFSLWDLYMIQLFQYLVERGFSREDSARRIALLRPFGRIDQVRLDSKIVQRKSFKSMQEDYNRYLTSRFLILPKRGQGIDRHPLAPRIANRDGSKEEPAIIECIVKEDDGTFVKYSSYGTKSSFSLDYFRHHDDILLVNFKKIREKVNALIK
jgi:hypothetical protein